MSTRPPTAHEPIAVTWDPERRRPTSFVWRKRRRRIERIVDTWVIETGWWDDGVRVRRRFYRVHADGRLFDICHDRLRQAWSLETVVS